MSKPRIRLRLRTLMIAVAVLTPLFYLYVIPACQYYALSPADRAIVDMLDRRLNMPFAQGTLQDVLKYLVKVSRSSGSKGIPIYVEPIALADSRVTMQAPVQINWSGEKLKTSLERALKPLGLCYQVKDGLLKITSERAIRLEQAIAAIQIPTVTTTPGGPKARRAYDSHP